MFSSALQSDCWQPSLARRRPQTKPPSAPSSVGRRRNSERLLVNAGRSAEQIVATGDSSEGGQA